MTWLRRLRLALLPRYPRPTIGLGHDDVLRSCRRHGGIHPRVFHVCGHDYGCGAAPDLGERRIAHLATCQRSTINWRSIPPDLPVQ